MTIDSESSRFSLQHRLGGNDDAHGPVPQSLERRFCRHGAFACAKFRRGCRGRVSGFGIQPHSRTPPPPATLNLGPIKDLLVEYHQKFYDADVAAVFKSAQNYVEKNASEAKRPALVLDIDETSLTNWPNLHADDFGFVPDGSCDELPAGPCGFNAWVLKGSATAIAPAYKLFEAAKAKGVAVIFITGRPNSRRDITILNLDHAGYEG